jgi:hypothetical protein
MATGDKRVKLFINGKLVTPNNRERKKIIADGKEFPMSRYEHVFLNYNSLCIMEFVDLEEYEQQIFVWNREVILNLN